jgi:hypothetical protein
MISKIRMKNRRIMRFVGDIDLERGLYKEGGIEIEIRDKTDSLGSTRKPLGLTSTMRPSSSTK